MSELTKAQMDEAKRFLARFVSRGWLSANRECIEEQWAVDLGIRRRWIRTEMSEAIFTPAGRAALEPRDER